MGADRQRDGIQQRCMAKDAGAGARRYRYRYVVDGRWQKDPLNSYAEASPLVIKTPSLS